MSLSNKERFQSIAKFERPEDLCLLTPDFVVIQHLVLNASTKNIQKGDQICLKRKSFTR